MSGSAIALSLLAALVGYMLVRSALLGRYVKLLERRVRALEQRTLPAASLGLTGGRVERKP